MGTKAKKEIRNLYEEGLAHDQLIGEAIANQCDGQKFINFYIYIHKTSLKHHRNKSQKTKQNKTKLSTKHNDYFLNGKERNISTITTKYQKRN